MTLLLILVLLTLVLFALFLGGSLVAQGYLYQQPADRLPIRALAAALLVALFITFWVWIDQNNPRRYDTFFEFAPYTTREFTEFEAVRWVSPDGRQLKTDDAGNPVEVGAKYRRTTGGKAGAFLEEGTDAPFQLNGVNKTGESFMTAAIKLKPEPDGEPIRLNAQVKNDKRTGLPTYLPERRFVEDKGSRYVQADQLGVLYVPSTRTVVVALLINFLLFVVWLAAFWPILRFTLGHALALTAVMGIVTMMLVMPLLFKPNRVAKPPEAAQAAVSRDAERSALASRSAPRRG